jgi:hypothetical protein
MEASAMGQPFSDPGFFIRDRGVAVEALCDGTADGLPLE